LHAPEIDGTVYLNDFGPFEALKPGRFYRCEVTEAHDYDFVARVVGEASADGRDVATEELAGAGVGL
jgi:ribosomal protein S12 methylthiotransferase